MTSKKAIFTMGPKLFTKADEVFAHWGQKFLKEFATKAGDRLLRPEMSFTSFVSLSYLMNLFEEF
jgi:hypothetical protein